MKLYLVTFVCILVLQICSTRADEAPKSSDEIKKSIPGVSDQFVADVTNIREKYANERFILRSLVDLLLKSVSAMAKQSDKSKIDVAAVRNYYQHSVNTTGGEAKVSDQVWANDRVAIVQSMLSRQLQPEKYNGVVYLFYVIYNPDATTEQVEKALNYLYGTGSVDTKDLNPNVSTPSASDCPSAFPGYSTVFDTLKSMKDVKQKVIQDVTAIHDKFPCQQYVYDVLKQFADFLKLLNGDVAKINACQIKEKKLVGLDFGDIESVWTTRLSGEAFHDLINFQKTITSDKSVSEIEKALEYLYADVPKSNC